MEEAPLYQQIIQAVRQEIGSSQIRPGEQLPSVREMTKRWNCSPGTVQRAYAELSRQGLVTSRAGQGTHVVDEPELHEEIHLRRAALIHRADAFLLETLTAGYDPGEIESALRIALDRWRVVEVQPSPSPAGVLRFAGSHDPAMSWIASNFSQIMPQYRMQLDFMGSLGGLIALAEGTADLAGSHLWDAESDSYNLPFIRRLLPGRQVVLITLAQRRLGLILPPGNPSGINDLVDLSQREVRFANRQPGSGTRVWLDANLRRQGIVAATIPGYGKEYSTHSAVALAVAGDEANVGIGLECSALSCGLDFIELALERYDLVIPAENYELPPVKQLAAWLASRAASEEILALGGYDTLETGKITWID